MSCVRGAAAAQPAPRRLVKRLRSVAGLPGALVLSMVLAVLCYSSHSAMQDPCLNTRPQASNIHKV